jgi:hypothetical protein
MRYKDEIWHTYRGITKTKEKNFKPRTFCLGASEMDDRIFSVYLSQKKKLTLLQMRQKAEIWQTYGGTTQIRGKI